MSGFSAFTVRVESQEPFLLLLIGHDVDERGGPLGAIGVFELLEEDLNCLAVWSVHGDEVDALCILLYDVSLISIGSRVMVKYLDLGRSFADVEFVGHDCGFGCGKFNCSCQL